MQTPVSEATNSTTEVKATGHDLALWREIAGVARGALAAQLEIARSTLERWEAERVAPDPDRAVRWLAALKACACERQRELARAGFSDRDLRGTELGRTLKRLMRLGDAGDGSEHVA